jgi:peptide/nickel transport system permease protein
MTARSKWAEFKVSMQPRTKEWKFMLRRMRESPLSVVGVSIIAVFVAIAVLAPVLAPPNPQDPFMIPQDLEIYKVSSVPSAPTLQHLFGTTGDQFDIYYACVWGTITAFRIGITTVAISIAIGVVIGVAAAYYGGMADEALMRFTDIIIAFPGLILAMALVIALPEVLFLDITLILAILFGVTTLFMTVTRSRIKMTLTVLAFFAATLILALVYPFVLRIPINRLDKVLISLWLIGWPGYARVIRGEVLRVKNEDYIEAARASGASDLRIVIRHILPNAVYPLLIMGSLDTGAIVLTAAALSFLGLGAPPNYADWGQIIQRSMNYISRQDFVANAFVFIIPGIFIFVFVLGWNLLGDAVRDIFDPTLRRR